MQIRQKDNFQVSLTEPIWPPLNFALKEVILHHKSLSRAMFSWALRRFQSEVRGVVIDMASGRKPSYWRIMELEKISQRIINIDIDYSCNPTAVGDICAVPLKSKIADNVIIISSLLHVPKPLKVLEEVRRLLKPGGLLIFYVPLVNNFGPSPQDFWRFTPDSISWLLEQSSFNEAVISPIGERWSAIADLLLDSLRLNWLFAPILVPLCFCLDKLSQGLLKKFGKRLPPCPIGYVVLARAV
jgi:SAM-dependent methyltransferase